jgi:hypothetical protein
MTSTEVIEQIGVLLGKAVPPSGSAPDSRVTWLTQSNSHDCLRRSGDSSLG